MDKKVLRSIIREVLNKQMDIYNSTEDINNSIINNIIDTINSYSAKINDGNAWDWSFTYPTNETFKKNTKINRIKINIEYTKSSENKITGKFISSKTVLLNDSNYEVYIDVDVKINNDVVNHSKRIESVLAHELHHAFRHIKTLGKNSKANLLNKAKNEVNAYLNELIQSTPPIKEFMQMIYLSLPQEMEARVQETATQLKYINEPNYNNAIESLRQYQPLRDAKRMIDYNLYEIEKVDQDTLKLFVETFNSAYKENKIDRIDKFFEFYKHKINKNGDILLRKILKQVADKYNIKSEATLMFEMDSLLLYKISKISFD